MPALRKNFGLIFVLIAAGLLWCGFGAGTAIYHWHENKQAAGQQTALRIELNIPGAEAGRTYTVVTKFRVQDRPFESTPIQIRWAEKQAPYPLTLYYNVKNPAKNSWKKFEGGDPRDLRRTIFYGLGFLLLGYLLLRWSRGRLFEKA